MKEYITNKIQSFRNWLAHLIAGDKLNKLEQRLTELVHEMTYSEEQVRDIAFDEAEECVNNCDFVDESAFNASVADLREDINGAAEIDYDRIVEELDHEKVARHLNLTAPDLVDALGREELKATIAKQVVRSLILTVANPND